MDSFTPTIQVDSFTPRRTDSFVPDTSVSAQSTFANLINAGTEVIKDIPAQIQDLLNIPAALLGTPRPNMVSKLSTETIPYIMEKATTPIGDFTIPTLTYNDVMSIMDGKFRYSTAEISPTPLDIGFYALMGASLARNQFAVARWNNQLDKLIKTEEVRGAVMNNMPAFEGLMGQVGIKLENMSLEDKTNFILSQARSSPKLGTAIMDLVKGKITPIEPTPAVKPIEAEVVKAGVVEKGVVPAPISTTSPEVPIVTPTTPVLSPLQPQGEAISPQVTPTTPEEPKAQEIPLETKTSKVAQSIATKLTEDFGELAQYTPTTIKEQASKVAEFIAKEPDKLRKVIAGEEPLPQGILGGTMIKAAEDYALQSGDVALIKDIASSPLTSETSVHAQEMRMLAERNPDSPVSAIQEINKAREKTAAKRLKTDTKKLHKQVVRDIKAEIKKTAPTKETWADFIKSIQC